MTEPVLLNGGDAIVVGGHGDRIGAGPWARLLASSVVPDESSPRAERGRALARSAAVRDVTVAPGSITARVRGSHGGEYDVALEAATMPAAVWRAAVRSARGSAALSPGVSGAGQSVHLAHLLETEHRSPLVPPTRDLRRRCTCPDRDWEGACKHAAALAFVVADAIDEDPSILLRWRGCALVDVAAASSRDPWEAGPVPQARPPRALPPGAVVKRLGRSGIRVGGVDLADALRPAYRAFASQGENRVR
jgi:uncharacterized Zn finger protein